MIQVPVFEAVPDEREECVYPTRREKEVLALIAQGYSNKMVASALCLSEMTVKNHMTSIVAKAGGRDRTASVVVALQQGWIKVVEDAT